MKTTCTLLMLTFALVSCHHDAHDGARRYSTDRSYRRTNDTDRRDTRPQRRPRPREEQRRTDNINALPYLPPFTMRWDCPTEPQMLGYASR